jgi:tRNA (guanosine-2'-O-)-methyltransferase
MLSDKRLKKLETVAQNRQSGLALVLEDIHDPHNVAAMLRTCEGLGIQDVYVIFEQEKRYNPRRVGKVSSSSANKWLTFHIFTSTKECFKELKKKGYITALTILDTDSENLYKAELTEKKLALVVGNEHRGVSAEAIKLADRKLYLPMAGFVQSFNVSVTAAIFLYEIVRQRMASKNTVRLSKKESARLLADFKKR